MGVCSAYKVTVEAGRGRAHHQAPALCSAVLLGWVSFPPSSSTAGPCVVLGSDEPGQGEYTKAHEEEEDSGHDLAWVTHTARHPGSRRDMKHQTTHVLGASLCFPHVLPRRVIV